MNKNELQSLLKSINEAHVQSLSEMDQPPMYGAAFGEPRPLMKDLLNNPQYAGQGRSQLQAHPAFAAYHHEHADHFKDIADNLNAFGYYGGDSGHDHEFHMQGLAKHFRNDHESLRDNLVAATKAHVESPLRRSSSCTISIAMNALYSLPRVCGLRRQLTISAYLAPISNTFWRK